VTAFRQIEFSKADLLKSTVNLASWSSWKFRTTQLTALQRLRIASTDVRLSGVHNRTLEVRLESACESLPQMRIGSVKGRIFDSVGQREC
jgi:hypothetical protein